MTTFEINHRFCGPPDSANGGYFSGVLASHLDVPRRTGVCVRLQSPPPLDVTIGMERDGDAVIATHDGVTLGRAWPQSLDLEVPSAPEWSAVVRAVEAYQGFRHRIFPRCFVCGPDRPPGDGLRIFAGALETDALLAAPWIPDPGLAGDGGVVEAPLLWAALDCPGAFTFPDFAAGPVLLGQFCVRIDGFVSAGDQVTALAWPIATAGRKHRAGTALVVNGEIIARAEAVWIRPRNTHGA